MAEETLEKISDEEFVYLAENKIPLESLKDIASPLPGFADCFCLDLKSERLIFAPNNDGTYYLKIVFPRVYSNMPRT